MQVQEYLYFEKKKKRLQHVCGWVRKSWNRGLKYMCFGQTTSGSSENCCWCKKKYEHRSRDCTGNMSFPYRYTSIPTESNPVWGDLCANKWNRRCVVYPLCDNFRRFLVAALLTTAQNFANWRMVDNVPLLRRFQQCLWRRFCCCLRRRAHGRQNFSANCARLQSCSGCPDNDSWGLTLPQVSIVLRSHYGWRWYVSSHGLICKINF